MLNYDEHQFRNLFSENIPLLTTGEISHFIVRN